MQQIQGITFEQIHMKAKHGLVCIDADQIKLKDVTIQSEGETVFTLYNSRHVQFDRVTRNTASLFDESFIRFDKNSSHIQVDSIDIAQVPEQIDQ